MGWVSTKIGQHVNMVRFWNRLINMNENRLTKRIFMWDFTLSNNNWSMDMFNLLSNYGMQHYYYELTECNINELKSKEVEIGEERWFSEMNNKPKLRTYATFKTKYEKETYVTMNLERDERSFLAKFRLGILPLRIETGRYKQEPLCERICEFCNLIP